MPFKIRDLMITVLPTHLYGAADCTANCSNADSDCPGGCSNGDTKFHTEDCRDWGINPGDLVELQALMHHALGEVQLVTEREHMRTRSAEQIETLERKLVGALDELKVQRAKLSKRGARGPSAELPRAAGPFKVRDLMISVLPFEGEGEACYACSGFTHPVPSDFCQGEEGDPLSDPDYLGTLQVTLQHALTRVNAALAEQQMQPQTLAQVDALQQKLTIALEGVREEKRRIMDSAE